MLVFWGCQVQQRTAAFLTSFGYVDGRARSEFSFPVEPQKGEVLFVSAASGAVGCLVGQLAAKIAGCTVIGSCGGPSKVAAVLSLGYHHAIDYKAHPSVESLSNAMKLVAPDGIDMDFEVSELVSIARNLQSTRTLAVFTLMRPLASCALAVALLFVEPSRISLWLLLRTWSTLAR